MSDKPSEVVITIRDDDSGDGFTIMASFEGKKNSHAFAAGYDVIEILKRLAYELGGQVSVVDTDSEHMH